jgi:hypothetical protein
MAQVLTELRSKGPVNGIVLDIRGNDGGDDEQGAAVVEFFTPPAKPYLYEHASYSNRLLSVAEEGNLQHYMSSEDLAEFGNIAGEALDKYGVEEEYSLNIDPEHLKAYSDPLSAEHVAGFEGAFQGPVVCMVNRYCDSTCEGIAYGLKQRAARGEASGSAPLLRVSNPPPRARPASCSNTPRTANAALVPGRRRRSRGRGPR